MDEFKGGTLKSGGSNKKVTNPKQAIAIAMSEAERLAGGGYIGEPSMNEYMNRPMFQTPQMRAGGGVMAGIAPINMEEGGEAAPVTQEDIESLGITIEEFTNASPEYQQYVLDTINSRRGISRTAKEYLEGDTPITNFITNPMGPLVSGIGSLIDRGSEMLGFSDIEKPQEEMAEDPRQRDVTMEELQSLVAPEPPPPPITNMPVQPVQPVETVETVSIEEDDEPTSWGGNLIDRFKGIMQDPNKRAGLINLGIPTAGTTPKPWYAKFQEGYKAEEDRGIAKLQAQADLAKAEAEIQETKAKTKHYENIDTPDEQYLFDFVRSKLPSSVSDSDVINMVVGTKGVDVTSIASSIYQSLITDDLWRSQPKEDLIRHAMDVARRIASINTPGSMPLGSEGADGILRITKEEFEKAS